MRWRDDLRRDNLDAVDELGVRHGFTMSLEHVQRLFGVSQVVVVNTVICHQSADNIHNKPRTVPHCTALLSVKFNVMITVSL